MNKTRLPLDTVVFDFDGTLGRLNIDFPLMRKEVTALACDFGVSRNGFENLYTLEMIAQVRSMIAKTDDQRGEEFSRLAMEVVTRIEVESAGQGSLLEGTREMLKTLKERRIKLAVVTRNCLAAVSVVFPDVHAYFGRAVITRDFTRRVKPNVDHLRIALAAVSSLPEKTAMVGDHPMDMTIGKDLGTYAIGVLTGYSKMAELVAAGADLVLARAAEVPSLVEPEGEGSDRWFLQTKGS